MQGKKGGCCCGKDKGKGKAGGYAPARPGTKKAPKKGK